MSRRLSKFTWCGALALMSATAPVHGFVANDRWSSTATDGSTGAWGSPVTVTWSIVPDGTTIPYGSTTTGSSLVRFLDANFGSGPGGKDYTQRPWFPIFQQSFDRLSALSGVTYVYEPNDDGFRFASNNNGKGSLGVRGDVRIAGRTYGDGSNTLASNYFPDYGEMIINTDRSTFFRSSTNGHRAFRNTIMHEAMHGLGISHVESSNARFLIEPTLSTAFDGPQMDDLLAMQRLYGDVYEKGGGNDFAATATPLGPITGAGRVIGSRGDSTVIAAVDVDFLSIDDDSDVDYFSFTLQETLDVSLSVLPKGTMYSVGPQDGVQTSFNSQALSDQFASASRITGRADVAAVDSSSRNLPGGRRGDRDCRGGL